MMDVDQAHKIQLLTEQIARLTAKLNEYPEVIMNLEHQLQTARDMSAKYNEQAQAHGENMLRDAQTYKDTLQKNIQIIENLKTEIKVLTAENNIIKNDLQNTQEKTQMRLKEELTSLTQKLDKVREQSLEDLRKNHLESLHIYQERIDELTLQKAIIENDLRDEQLESSEKETSRAKLANDIKQLQTAIANLNASFEQELKK